MLLFFIITFVITAVPLKMLLFFTITAIAIFTYWFIIKPHHYWTEKGVKQNSLAFIARHNFKTIFRREALANTSIEIYNSIPNTRYSGQYLFCFPSLMLRNPELIKQITVKDFDHFVDRKALIPPEVDPLWSKNLFASTGQKWKDMRSTLSPAFTSSKMRHMFVLIAESAEQFVEYFLKQKENVITVEMKDVFSRFTNDVIATIAFGIKCDSLVNRNNEFYLTGKSITNLSNIWTNLKLMIYMMFPKMFSFFNIGFFSKTDTDFFTQLIKQTIETREKLSIVRPDMINLLMEARNHGLKYEESNEMDAGFATAQESEIGKTDKQEKIEITDIDITAQALIFFFAGFETLSGIMCFMAYELGVDNDVQQKLRNEIDETRRMCGEKKVTYEALLNMKYMDMVVSETLRKWPINMGMDRVCTKDYIIQPVLPYETPIVLNKNDVIWLPIFALHRDPQYFPDPDKFNPERFSEENRDKIVPYSYIPFGSGPRNCIGSRLALLETKTLFFYLLSYFEIVPVEQSEIPLKLSRKQMSLTAENGFWFGLKRRDM